MSLHAILDAAVDEAERLIEEEETRRVHEAYLRSRGRYSP